MNEKARQGHWPTVAPVGYVNNPMSHRIETDPERAPIIVEAVRVVRLRRVSLKVLTKKAVGCGPDEPHRGGEPARAVGIHQVLQESDLLPASSTGSDSFTRGSAQAAIISRDLYDRVAVFAAANHPRHTKRRHAFAGLVTCGRCGCAIHGRDQEGPVTCYYHCTGHRGPCGNAYVREEELIRQFGELLKTGPVPTEPRRTSIADRASGKPADKGRSSSGPPCLRLQQQQRMLLRSKLDQGIRGPSQRCRFPEELWNYEISGAAGRASPSANRDGASRGRQSGVYDGERTLQILNSRKTAYSSV